MSDAFSVWSKEVFTLLEELLVRKFFLDQRLFSKYLNGFFVCFASVSEFNSEVVVG